MQMIDILRKIHPTIWIFEFLNNLDAQRDFDKILSQKIWSSRTILIFSML